MAEAKALLRANFKPDIETGLFNSWVKHIAVRMFRPESLAVAPLKIRDKRNPTDRLDNLLAWRAKGRCSGGVIVQTPTLGRTAVINLLALALCVDAFITPTIAQPLRRDYVFPLIGQRFMGRRTIAQTKMRLRSKLIRTGYVSYGPEGRTEELKRIETEEAETTAYRIRRADYRLIGRMLWDLMSRTLLVGGRYGQEWAELRDELRRRIGGPNERNVF
jgi:hypothetical protein